MLRMQDAPASAGAFADVGLVGNGQIAALVGADGCIEWCCWPRPDGDPIFCALLGYGAKESDRGVYSIELLGQRECAISYRRNTAIMESVARDDRGNAIRVTTWCPRYQSHTGLYRPGTLVRRVEPVAGRPTIRIRLRPACEYGARACAPRFDSHYIRFVDSTCTVRVTTDCPISYVAEERAFVLDRAINLVLGEDEVLADSPHRIAQNALDSTAGYWTRWVQGLSIPFDWQESTIRAAITLQCCTYEDTGAVLASPTTSIPEAAGSGRNWDYRYCWLRDAHFTVRALNRLGVTGAMESFLSYLDNIVVREGESLLQPVYGISGERNIDERVVETLPGFSGMGPVRVGNLACRQRQHDVYGSVILASTQSFFDERLDYPGEAARFNRLEALGERAALLFDQADSGIWETRGSLQRHTFSAAMCAAACDRLARIAVRLRLSDRARYWRKRAVSLTTQIVTRSWSEGHGSFSASLDEHVVDASLLLLPELGIVEWRDPRFQKTLAVVERELTAGSLLTRHRHDAAEGPANAFTVCSFWWANALAESGRVQEARAIFERLLDARNPLGLLAEQIDSRTGALWGNFPHTSSMVGLITTASRLSRRWEDEL